MVLQDKNLLRKTCFINGKWISANNNQTIAVCNPFNEAEVGSVPNCGQAETIDAIDAAYLAWPSWRNKTAGERATLLFAWASLIDEHQHDLAYLMTVEQGKPLTESLAEIAYANSFVKWYAEEARRAYGDIIPSTKPNQHLLVIKQSVGVVAAITPWNFPAAMITRKIAPALAVGCTVIVKPDSATPLTALALAYLAEQAGFPPGVINMVTGDAKAIGAEMTANPKISKLSFTGSTNVGRLLMEQSAPTLKKISLELGGNAPFIVFEDADIDAAVAGAIASKFRNTGQTCVCANRIYVHESIYQEFAEKLTDKVKMLTSGNGLDDDVQLGPLINHHALNKVAKHVENAIEHGGKVLCGGKPHALGGLFYEPTVITNANASMLLAHEETFGPVAPLFKFSSDQEVIDFANATEYGLAAYFYTKDMDRTWYVSENLAYGMVGVNTGIISTEVAPFGGIKQSGMGREGSKYGLDAYTELKYICMQKTR